MGEGSKRGSERPVSGLQNSIPWKVAYFGAPDLDSEKPAGSSVAKELDLIFLSFKLRKQTKHLLCVEDSGKLPGSLSFLQQKENEENCSS